MLRKAIDYYCHLAVKPEFWPTVSQNDPDFMASENAEGAPAAPTYEALAEEGAGLAVRLARQSGISFEALQDMSYQDLREAAYEDRFDAWDCRDV